MTSAMPPRVRENVLGSTPPQLMSRRISDVVSGFNRINLRPCYQRPIKWKLATMCDLIKTIMINTLLPIFYMYRLPDDESQGKYDEEVMDGQHRLWTINAFITSSLNKLPHINKAFIVHWCYETIDENGNKHIQRVFYKMTEEVINWFRDTYPDAGEPCFLTPEERKRFDDYYLNIMVIHKKLTMNERREMFLNYQKGLPVRNSDLLKNMTSCKLMADLELNGYEQMMTIFLEFSSKKAPNYWTQWAVRCFLLFLQSKQEKSDIESSDIFLKTDSSITQAIKARHVQLNPTDEQFDDFDTKFTSFIELLQRQSEGTLFNPTQLFAMFYHLCSSECDVDILNTHMPNFAEEGQHKSVKGLWENKDKVETRRAYYNDCLIQLRDMTEPYVALQLDERPVSKAMKKRVFAKAVVSDRCDLCQDEITLETFEASHIVARAKGGSGRIDNLIPLCRDCNRRSGTLDPYVYKETVLPYNRI